MTQEQLESLGVNKLLELLGPYFTLISHNGPLANSQKGRKYIARTGGNLIGEGDSFESALAALYLKCKASGFENLGIEPTA